MEDDNNYIHFDWAAKRMLRDKANFGVFEGLITVLLNEPVHIVEILESNQKEDDSTYGCVVLKAINKEREEIIVEIQNIREYYYRWHLFKNHFKPFPVHNSLGGKDDTVKKIYSISILYFDLGQGFDYLYHGQETLVGVHGKDTLIIKPSDEGLIRVETPKNITPEYFIIRLNAFDKEAETPLEEWLDYLKTGHVKDDTTDPGLQEVREKLQDWKLDRRDNNAYFRHLDYVMYQNDVLDTAKMEGRAEGFREGLGKARAELSSKRAMAKKMKTLGIDPHIIGDVMEMSIDNIAKL